MLESTRPHTQLERTEEGGGEECEEAQVQRPINSDDRRGAVTETKPVRVSKERHTACVRERRVYR